MFERDLAEELLSVSQFYPIATIMGPRQSGKTTLAKQVFPDKPYINLEQPEQRLLAETDPVAFLSQHPDGAILDEIQTVPELLSYIQVLVDERQEKSMFILTGSHQLGLHEKISQSLAGRTSILKLLPLSLNELKQGKMELDLDSQLLSGGYPRLYKDKITPSRYYQDYVQTYIERDVRNIANVHDLVQFQRFMHLIASRVGQVFDKTSLSNDLGISRTAITHWASILEASFILFRLPPYFKNYGKRVIKTPKLFFTDVGLLCYLLGIEELNQLCSHPLRGFIFENLVILELMKYRYNHGKEANFFYYRDSNQREVDLVIPIANTLIPVEIKVSQTYNKAFLSGVKYFSDLVGDEFKIGFIVYNGKQEQRLGNFSLLNYSNVGKIFQISMG